LLAPRAPPMPAALDAVCADVPMAPSSLGPSVGYSERGVLGQRSVSTSSAAMASTGHGGYGGYGGGVVGMDRSASTSSAAVPGGYGGVALRDRSMSTASAAGGTTVLRERSNSASRRMREMYADAVRNGAPVARTPSDMGTASSSMAPAAAPVAAPLGGPRGIRIRCGVLEFGGAANGTSTGLFDSVRFRVALRWGGDRPAAAMVAANPSGHGVAPYLVERPRWQDNGPATQPKQLKFGRTVAQDGSYMARVSCDCDEAIDLPWPPVIIGNAAATPQLAADVWLERRSAVEKIDSVLSMFGMGAGLTEYERVWLGRAFVCLPPVGSDSMLYPWPVEVDGVIGHDGPLPKFLSVGIEWVDSMNSMNSMP